MQLIWQAGAQAICMQLPAPHSLSFWGGASFVDWFFTGFFAGGFLSVRPRVAADADAGFIAMGREVEADFAVGFGFELAPDHKVTPRVRKQAAREKKSVPQSAARTHSTVVSLPPSSFPSSLAPSFCRRESTLKTKAKQMTNQIH